METCCTCKSCGNQFWIISQSKIVCSKCGKEFKLYDDTKAVSLVNLTNVIIKGGLNEY